MKSREISLEIREGEEVDYDFEFTPEEVRAEFGERGCADLGVKGSVKASLSLGRSREGLKISGEVAGSVAVACVRCLETCVAPLKTSFSVRVLKGRDVEDAEGAHGEEIPEDVEIASGDRHDITALVFDQLLLGLPEYPLCKEECPGLCPDCGADLNKEKCGCGAEKKVDPRLAVLAGLKKGH